MHGAAVKITAEGKASVRTELQKMRNMPQHRVKSRIAVVAEEVRAEVDPDKPVQTNERSDLIGLSTIFALE